MKERKKKTKPERTRRIDHWRGPQAHEKLGLEPELPFSSHHPPQPISSPSSHTHSPNSQTGPYHTPVFRVTQPSQPASIPFDPQLMGLKKSCSIAPQTLFLPWKALFSLCWFSNFCHNLWFQFYHCWFLCIYMKVLCSVFEILGQFCCEN